MFLKREAFMYKKIVFALLISSCYQLTADYHAAAGLKDTYNGLAPKDRIFSPVFGAIMAENGFLLRMYKDEAAEHPLYKLTHDLFYIIPGAAAIATTTQPGNAASVLNNTLIKQLLDHIHSNLQCTDLLPKEISESTVYGFSKEWFDAYVVRIAEIRAARALDATITIISERDFKKTARRLMKDLDIALAAHGKELVRDILLAHVYLKNISPGRLQDFARLYNPAIPHSLFQENSSSDFIAALPNQMPFSYYETLTDRIEILIYSLIQKKYSDFNFLGMPRITITQNDDCRYPNCMEQMSQTLINFFLYNPEKGILDPSLLPRGITCKPELEAFIAHHNNPHAKNYGPDTAQEWATLVSGIPGVQYEKAPYEVLASASNMLALLNALFQTNQPSLELVSTSLRTPDHSIVMTLEESPSADTPSKSVPIFTLTFKYKNFKHMVVSLNFATHAYLLPESEVPPLLIKTALLAETLMRRSIVSIIGNTYRNMFFYYWYSNPKRILLDDQPLQKLLRFIFINHLKSHAIDSAFNPFFENNNAVMRIPVGQEILTFFENAILQQDIEVAQLIASENPALIDAEMSIKKVTPLFFLINKYQKDDRYVKNTQPLNLECIKFLLEHGASPHKKHYPASLNQSCCPIDRKEVMINTPFLQAFSYTTPNTELLELLLAYARPTDFIPNNPWSYPLMYRLLGNNIMTPTLLKKFIDQGADPTIKITRTPKDFDDIPTIRAFSRPKAESDTPDQQANVLSGSNALHILLCQEPSTNNAELIKILASKVDVNEPNQEGKTPLEMALLSENTEGAKILIEAGAIVPPVINELVTHMLKNYRRLPMEKPLVHK